MLPDLRPTGPRSAQISGDGVGRRTGSVGGGVGRAQQVVGPDPGKETGRLLRVEHRHIDAEGPLEFRVLLEGTEGDGVRDEEKVTVLPEMHRRAGHFLEVAPERERAAHQLDIHARRELLPDTSGPVRRRAFSRQSAFHHGDIAVSAFAQVEGDGGTDHAAADNDDAAAVQCFPAQLEPPEGRAGRCCVSCRPGSHGGQEARGAVILHAP
nr:hypothetical protein [Streptomyces sp. RTd22]